MPARQRHRLAQRAEHVANSLDDHNAEAEGDQDLILLRPRVVEANKPTLGSQANQQQHQRAQCERGGERVEMAQHHESRVGAQHEHRAVREIEHAQGAENDGEPTGDQRQQATERDTVKCLREELGKRGHRETVLAWSAVFNKSGRQVEAA
jgi:hypothetical protein